MGWAALSIVVVLLATPWFASDSRDGADWKPWPGPGAPRERSPFATSRVSWRASVRARLRVVPQLRDDGSRSRTGTVCSVRSRRGHRDLPRARRSRPWPRPSDAPGGL